MRVDNEDINIYKRGQDPTWIPSRALYVFLCSLYADPYQILFRTSQLLSPCQLTVIVKAGHTYAGIAFGKAEVQTKINSDDITKAFWDSDDATLSVPSMSDRFLA